LWHSIASVDASFKDAYSVLTPEGKVMADRSWARRNLITDKSDGSLKTHMDAWLKNTKGLDVNTDPIPFYNRPLVYPEPGETPSQDLLSQIDLAKEVRREAVDFLRRDHRTDNSLPGNFEPLARQTGDTIDLTKITDAASLAFKGQGYDLKIANSAAGSPTLKVLSGDKQFAAQFDRAKGQWTSLATAQLPPLELSFGKQIQNGTWHELHGDGYTMLVTQYSNKGPLVDLAQSGQPSGRARLDLLTGKWSFSTLD
jgi:hypothetical protein